MSAGQTIAAIIRATGAGASALGRQLSGDAAVATTLAGAILQAGAELLSIGLDPVVELRRVADRAGPRQATRAAWDAALRKKYGAPLDPYEDEP